MVIRLLSTTCSLTVKSQEQEDVTFSGDWNTATKYFNSHCSLRLSPAKHQVNSTNHQTSEKAKMAVRSE